MPKTNIEDLLKRTNARISYEDKWLIWYCNEWEVLQRPYGKKANRSLYSGNSFEIALEILERKQ